MERYLPVEPVDNVTTVAAANGHLEILQWLYDIQQERVHFRDIEICGALENKHHNVVACLRERAMPRTECMDKVLRSAVKAGNLSIAKWLCDEFASDASDMLQFAINSCHEETARWIIERFDVSGGNLKLYFLAKLGNLQLLKYLASRQMATVHEGMLLVAAANGHLDVIKWLHCEQGLVLTSDAMREAAQNGNVHVVQWLFDTDDSTCDSSVFVGAAEYGHLDVLQWLQTRWSGSCGTVAMDWAARSGHLDVVQWLHEHCDKGCSVNAVDEAATNGHLDVVKWLHKYRSEGCTTLAMDGAAGAGHLEIVKWPQRRLLDGSNERCSLQRTCCRSAMATC